MELFERAEVLGNLMHWFHYQSTKGLTVFFKDEATITAPRVFHPGPRATARRLFLVALDPGEEPGCEAGEDVLRCSVIVQPSGCPW